MLDDAAIHEYLAEIDEGLRRRDLCGEVVICGGAVMCAVYRSRQATRDIDGLFEPAREIREIAAEIAERHGLDGDWLNDGAKGFIDTSRMEFVEVERFGNLVVLRPDDEAMLAMKLASAREGTSDLNDALFLMEKVGVESLEQVYEIMERRINPARLTPLSSFFAQEVFERYRAKAPSPAERAVVGKAAAREAKRNDSASVSSGEVRVR